MGITNISDLEYFRPEEHIDMELVLGSTPLEPICVAGRGDKCLTDISNTDFIFQARGAYRHGVGARVHTPGTDM